MEPVNSELSVPPQVRSPLKTTVAGSKETPISLAVMTLSEQVISNGGDGGSGRRGESGDCEIDRADARDSVNTDKTANRLKSGAGVPSSV